VALTKSAAMVREMPRSGGGGGGAYVRPKREEDEEGDERPTDNPTSRIWFQGCRFEVLPYPPNHAAGNEEEAIRVRNSGCRTPATPPFPAHGRRPTGCVGDQISASLAVRSGAGNSSSRVGLGGCHQNANGLCWARVPALVH
jgi:hypothetical protein